jgi:hypothetical protein
MSSIVSGFRRPVSDHFEPQDSLSLQEQKKLRGQLEQIDFTAYASNKEVIAQVLGDSDAEQFQHMALAVARARAEWIAEALKAGKGGRSLASDQVARLRQLRMAFEELSEAYDGLRRMVERGYLHYQGP